LDFDSRTLRYERCLFIVLSVAIVLRVVAVIYARGYLASDDFFETVRIAVDWAHGRVWDANGFLNWHGAKSGGVMRSPIYNFILAGGLKLGMWLGLGTLAAQMFLIRSVLALFSLLPVYYGFRFAWERSNPATALNVGLLLAAFYPVPFLSVRALIEVAAGNLLVPGLYYADRSWRTASVCAALWSGLFVAGIWIVRPQALVVAAPVGLLLLGRRWQWRRAVAFAIPVAAVALAEGLLEIPVTGRFFGAMINYWHANLHKPPISGPWYRYLLLITAAYIPPFSIWIFAAAARPSVRRGLPVWWWSVVIFLVAHSAFTYKQERFIFPIIAPLIVLGGLATGSLPSGRWYGSRTFKRIAWSYFWIVNVALLIVFTLTYSHRGRVEPFVYIGDRGDARGIVVDCTRRLVYPPVHYAGYPPPPAEVFEHLPERATPFLRDTANYLVIFADRYPLTSLERWNIVSGPYQLVHECPPSLLDRFLQWINPKYNHSNRSWVFRK